MHEIEIMLDELDVRTSKLKSKPKKDYDSSDFSAFVVSEAKKKYETSFLDKVTEFNHRIDYAYDLGYFYFKIINKENPSEITLDGEFDISLLKELEKKGKLLHRRIDAVIPNAENASIQYAYLFKDTVVVTTYTTDFKEQKQYLRTVIIFHSLSVTVDIPFFNKFKKVNENKSKIGLIKQSKFGPTVSWIDHETDTKFSLEYYNDDFSEFFEKIKTDLVEENNGLYLFYGEAGTGKSSAIRHLISEIDRPFVFIPPQMINYLTTPEFTDLVTTSLKGSVLIIEDAEKALMKRESEDGFFNSELVSSLLNLTDGLYADLAKTTIIATYNCDRNLIDPALLRRGRMKAEYKFDRLSVDKSQKLMDTLKNDLKVEDPMTLADIFNFEKQYSNEGSTNKKSKRVVGFSK